MLRVLKRSAPNLYIIVVALSISLWFEGVNILMNYLVPDKNIYIGIGMCTISLAVFYFDDGSLSELYNPGSNTDIAAYIASSPVRNREV